MTDTLPANEVICEECGAVFKPTINVENLPVYNKVRKYDWLQMKCPDCNTSHRTARLNEEGFNIIILRE